MPTCPGTRRYAEAATGYLTLGGQSPGFVCTATERAAVFAQNNTLNLASLLPPTDPKLPGMNPGLGTAL